MVRYRPHTGAGGYDRGPPDSPGGAGLRRSTQEGPMRRLRVFALMCVVIALVACGRTTAVPMPVATAGILTLATAATPIVTSAAARSAGPQRADVTPIPTPASPATPTPLSTRAAVTASTAAPTTVAQSPPTAPVPRTPVAATAAPPTSRVADLPAGAPQQTIGV